MDHQWRTSELHTHALQLAQQRDQRLVAEPPVTNRSFNSLYVWVQKQLRAVAAPGVSIEALVKRTGAKETVRSLTCGERKGQSFCRRDGVTCNFLINMREGADGLHLLSYSLHLDAPPEARVSPAFLRWEYSVERKSDVDAITEPQSHLHPGHDYVRLPSPVLSPEELVLQIVGLELWR